MHPRALALAVLALLALPGCDSVARIELSPASLRFGVRGQTAKIHASPVGKNGKSIPAERCAWSTSDAKVATVEGPGNDAVVTAVGPGAARIACAVKGVTGQVDVLVRVVAKVTVAPERVELRMLDEPTPVALEVAAFDDAGGQVLGRTPFSRCASEDVCRGDARGQLWAVGPGDTTAVVEVDGARSAGIAVHVVDARSPDARPKAVKGNPMEEIERKYLRKVAEEKKAEERARAEGSRGGK
jgi:hypothetical protein